MWTVVVFAIRNILRNAVKTTIHTFLCPVLRPQYVVIRNYERIIGTRKLMTCKPVSSPACLLGQISPLRCTDCPYRRGWRVWLVTVISTGLPPPRIARPTTNQNTGYENSVIYLLRLCVLVSRLPVTLTRRGFHHF